MFSKIATEALIQRGKSPLYLEVINLFKKSQDLLINRPNLTNGEICRELSSMGWDKKATEIVRSATKTPIKGVKISNCSDPNMMFLASVDKPSRLKNKNKTPRMVMEEINRFYDHRSGKMVNNLDLSESAYKGSLYIFSGCWKIREKDGSFMFTAEELAAVFLHELGHNDFYIRSLYSLYVKILDASDIIDYVKFSHNEEVISSLVKAIKNSPYLDNNEWGEVIKQVEDYFKTYKFIDDPFYAEALSSMLAVMASEVFSQNIKMFAALEEGIFSKIPTETVYLDNERSADEFSVRNGSYSALVSYIKKADLLEGPKLSMFYEQVMGYKASLIVSMFYQLKSTFNLKPEEVNQGYDPILRRIELIIETSKHAFHNEFLPPDIADSIRQEILISEKYLEEYKSSEHRRVRALIKKWKTDVSRLRRIIKSPVHNRLEEDYHRLQEANRSLSRHPLYYLAKT